MKNSENEDFFCQKLFQLEIYIYILKPLHVVIIDGLIPPHFEIDVGSREADENFMLMLFKVQIINSSLDVSIFSSWIVLLLLKLDLYVQMCNIHILVSVV